MGVFGADLATKGLRAKIVKIQELAWVKSRCLFARYEQQSVNPVRIVKEQKVVRRKFRLHHLMISE